MVERALNAFWILLGVGASYQAYKTGLTGSMGPDSGLFPLIAGALIAAGGAVLLALPSTAARSPEWPRGAALGRVAGVLGGLALMAAAMDHIGFAAAAALTMLVLLRTVGRSGWIESMVLTAASVGAVLWIFGRVLAMQLPRGPWGW